MQERICIVGAGPAGLVTLANLLLVAKKNSDKKFHVEMIEKRSLEDLSRRQKIIVYGGKLSPGLKPETNWFDFCKILFSSELEVIPPNKRQTFLKKLLLQDKTPIRDKNFSIKDLQEALLEHLRDPKNKLNNVEIAWNEKSEILEVDSKKNTLLIQKINEKKEIAFDTLALCEGSNREITEKIKDLVIPREFIFKPFKRQPNPYHCAVRLKLKSLQDIEQGKYINYAEVIKNAKISPEEVRKKLYSLGWRKENSPRFVADANAYFFKEFAAKGIPRIFIASEITPSIFDEPENTRREKIIEWAKQLAALSFEIPPDYFEFDNKGETADKKLNATVFTVELDYVDNPVRKLPGGAKVVLVGDSAMKPLYPGGFSSTILLLLSECLAQELIINNDPKFKEYIKSYNLYREYIRSVLEMYYPKSSAIKSTFFKSSSQKIADELSTAVIKNDTVKVKELLNQGANVNAKNSKGKTSFEIALASQNLTVLEDFFLNGANPNKKIKFKNTILFPLLIAVEKDNVDLARLLLSWGADPNKKTNNRSALSIATTKNNQPMIQLLTDHGADLKHSSMKFKG